MSTAACRQPLVQGVLLFFNCAIDERGDVICDAACMDRDGAAMWKNGG